jgi:hypothetical protein
LDATPEAAVKDETTKSTKDTKRNPSFQCVLEGLVQFSHVHANYGAGPRAQITNSPDLLGALGGLGGAYSFST